MSEWMSTKQGFFFFFSCVCVSVWYMEAYCCGIIAYLYFYFNRLSYILYTYFETMERWVGECVYMFVSVYASVYVCVWECLFWKLISVRVCVLVCVDMCFCMCFGDQFVFFLLFTNILLDGLLKDTSIVDLNPAFHTNIIVVVIKKKIQANY